MSTISSKPRCIACEQEITILKCESCYQSSCVSQLVLQHDEISRQSDARNVKAQQQQHALIQQVDDWECDTIHKIRQTAEEGRRLILEHTTERISRIEARLTKLTEELRHCYRENSFISKNVSQWHNELAELTRQMVIPSQITVEEVSTPLVTKIVVRLPDNSTQIIDDGSSYIPNIAANARWIQNATTVVGGNGHGNGLNQFSYAYGLCIDDDRQAIYVTDFSNSRVMEWKIGSTSGQVIAGNNWENIRSNMLNSPTAVIVHKETDSLVICDYGNKRVVRWPRRSDANAETIISNVGCWGLAMDGHGYLYVSDYDKHKVKRWRIGEMNGIVVAGGNGQGNRLDQLYGPTYIFVDQEQSVYVCDGHNHRVTKWMIGAKEGIVVAGSQSPGNSLTQLFNPRGIIVDQIGTVYVSDHSNYRVLRWLKGATQGTLVVGGNKVGSQPNQFNSCFDLKFDRQGNLYVSDHNNQRIQKFNIDSNSIL